MSATYRLSRESVRIKKAEVEGSTSAWRERSRLAGVSNLLGDLNSRTQLSATLLSVPLYRSVSVDSNFIQEFTLC